MYISNIFIYSLQRCLQFKVSVKSVNPALTTDFLLAFELPEYLEHNDLILPFLTARSSKMFAVWFPIRESRPN